MMPGMIMLWYGSIDSIPSGWHLCDGAAGTPDLRDKFVPCAGGIYDPGATGGVNQHNHHFTGDGHAHDLVSGNDIDSEISGGSFSHETSINPVSGTTDLKDARPPYYALCYIMKLPIP